MPPKAPAVTHSHPPQPQFLEARLDPAWRGAGLCWDSSFGQQGQATAATASHSPGAARREKPGFKQWGGIYYSAGGIKRWTEGLDRGHGAGLWQRRGWPYISWAPRGLPSISSTRDFFAKQAERVSSAFYYALAKRPAPAPTARAQHQAQPLHRGCSEPPHPARARLLQAALVGTGLGFHWDFSGLEATPWPGSLQHSEPPREMLGQQPVPRNLRVPSGAEPPASACRGHHRARGTPSSPSPRGVGGPSIPLSCAKQ